MYRIGIASGNAQVISQATQHNIPAITSLFVNLIKYFASGMLSTHPHPFTSGGLAKYDSEI